MLFSQKNVVAGAAHNEYLELLSAFGLVGAAIFTVLVWRYVRIARASPAFGPVQYAALGAILVWTLNATLEFPLQDPATLLLAVASMAILAANPNCVRSDTLRLRVGSRTAAIAAAAPIAGAIGIQVLCNRFTDASKYYRISNNLIGAGDARGGYVALREAYIRNP